MTLQDDTGMVAACYENLGIVSPGHELLTYGRVEDRRFACHKERLPDFLDRFHSRERKTPMQRYSMALVQAYDRAAEMMKK